MKTSVNNNNIESNNQEFFTKGKKYRCIRDVVMKKGGKTVFKAGSIYEQTNDPTHWVGWLRNEQGERHGWPQPVYIADEVKTWGTKPEDIDPRLYFEPVEDVKEAEGIKVGDKVRHNKHEEVATVTAIREAFVNRCDGYRYLYTLDFGQSVKGPFDVELNGGEFLREAFTLQEASEIKPKAAFQIGDRVERKSDGELGTVDGYDVTDGKLTYIVKYDRAQRRESDGFEYLSEELNVDELQAVRYLEQGEVESLTAKYAKQIEDSALMGCGCMVGDGDESRKDSKCVKVRTAYKNDSHDPKDWTYCVSWYETTPIKGDADGQHQTLRECENGILLEQAARNMAYFELMARKGWTLDEILYGKAA